MKLYRDLKPDEILQAGDEWRARHWSATTWHIISPTSSEVGQPILPGFKIDYRRPVDLPVLQPVTPEAMAELEGREAWVILFRHRESQWNRYARATYVPLGRCWFGSDGNKIDPLDFCWFIVPDTIPEVQQ